MAVLTATKTLGVAFGISVIFSSVWLLFMRYCVKFAVYSLFTLTLLAEIVGGVLLFYVSSTMENTWGRSFMYGLAVLATLLVMYTIYVIHSMCSRVALAASMIKVSGGVLKTCPSIFVIHALLAVMKFLWTVFCGAAAWGSFASTGSSFWLAIAFALMTYWGLDILGNAALVTSYGTFGKWYYHNAPTVCVPFCRAFSRDFGSICFGSLLVAIVETIHDVLHALKEKGYIPGWTMCCIDRMLEGIKSAMEYINTYGFVQVAVSDENFFAASRRALSFLKYKGLTALINDTVVSRMASLGALAGGLLSGMGAVLLQRYLHHAQLDKLSFDSNQEATLATAGFGLGFFVVYTLIAPIHAMATALLVCFAEHPEVLARDHLEEYNTLIEPWEAVYGSDFVDKAATVANLHVEQNGLYLGGHSKPGVLHPLAEELEELVRMHEKGDLTEQEFISKKNQLLSH